MPSIFERKNMMTIYDLHTHTTYSDGRATVEYLIQQAESGGYHTGVSDHLYCDGNDTTEDIIQYLDAVSGYGIPVGGEANIGEVFQLPDAQIKRFDYLIASVHAVFPPDGKFAFNRYFAMRCGFCSTWPGYDKSRAAEYLELSYRQIAEHFARYRTEILGHAGVMPFYDDLPSDSNEILDWEKSVIALCKKYHIALEISSMWEEPYYRMLRTAKDAGLQFSFGSDCHTLEQVGNLSYSLEMAKKLNLTQSDLFIPEAFRRDN